MTDRQTAADREEEGGERQRDGGGDGKTTSEADRETEAGRPKKIATVEERGSSPFCGGTQSPQSARAKR